MSTGDTPVNPKRKAGRPKGKPLSKAERAQRRSAAVKHGQYAETTIAQSLPPCKPSTCEVYPCEIKQEAQTRGGDLSQCPISLADGDLIERFRAAIVEGDTKGLAELSAASLAGMADLERAELARLRSEGLVIDVEFPVGREEDGSPIIITRPVENPRADKLLKISTMLGHTADQQMITPKSRGEKAMATGIEQLGRAAWLRAKREEIGAALREEGDD